MAPSFVTASEGKDSGSDDGTTTSTDNDEAHLDIANPPLHPIPSMQDAFNESIMDSDSPEDESVRVTLDAAARRLQLLELSEFSDEYSSRWKQKPGSKYHPLFKLIAQVSFGVHLLQQRLAKSDQEVVEILQTHIDDIDGFIEDTQADFDLAIRDINDRLKYLKMPLEHSEEFDRMLDNRDFRVAIIDGNDIIERIIFRTAKAMRHSTRDVKKGLEATSEFAKYLDRIGSAWADDSVDLQNIYDAMRGNAEGWYQCFNKILHKGRKLTRLMEKLEGTVTEVSRRAGLASRRNMDQARSRRTSAQRQKTPQNQQLQQPHSRQHSRTPLSTGSASSTRSPSSTHDKPLPPDPTLQAQTVKALLRSQSTYALAGPRTPVQTPPLPTVRPTSSTHSQQRTPRPDYFRQQSQRSNRSGSEQPNGLGIHYELEAPSRYLTPVNMPVELDSREVLPLQTTLDDKKDAVEKSVIQVPTRYEELDTSKILELSDVPDLSFDKKRFTPPATVSTEDKFANADPGPPPPLPTSNPIPDMSIPSINIGRRPHPSPIIGELKPSTSLSSHPPDLDMIKLHDRLRAAAKAQSPVVKQQSQPSSPMIGSHPGSPMFAHSREVSQNEPPVSSAQQSRASSTRAASPSVARKVEPVQRVTSPLIPTRAPSSPLSDTTQKATDARRSSAETKKASTAEHENASPCVTVDSAYSSCSDAASAVPAENLRISSQASSNETTHTMVSPSIESPSIKSPNTVAVTSPRLDVSYSGTDYDDSRSDAGDLTALPQWDHLDAPASPWAKQPLKKRSFASLRDMFGKKAPSNRPLVGGGLGGHVAF